MSRIRIGLLAFFITIPLTVALQAQDSSKTDQHREWITDVLNDVQKIKVGMTRGEMRKVFSEEGGISTTFQRTYVYRDCLYIQVNFQFEPRGPKVKDAEGRFWQPESDQDVIKSMSKPYLEFSVVD